MTKNYKVAVVGATGAVGAEMLKCLADSSIPVSEVVPMARVNFGKTISFRGNSYMVKKAEKEAFSGVDIALFSAGEAASRELAPQACEMGAVVIDNSNAFRMETEVPLVVPEINPASAKNHKGIIANPNCSTIQMLVALNPLHQRFKIKRIVVSTYQAVSGTGIQAIDELKNQVTDYINEKEISWQVYPHQIAFNALPHIDKFLDNGYTKEEMKMLNETRKILDDMDIKVCPTTVRVPVVRCHSEAINIETENPLPEVEEVRKILASAPGVKVVDDPANNIYPLAVDCEGLGEVFVGRIRKDFTIENGLNLWVVSDNLLKGAALNAVQIAELLVSKNWL